jgi:hypothetical protein
MNEEEKDIRKDTDRTPKSPQNDEVKGQDLNIPTEKDHSISSEKKIDLSDEDKALDSGI